MQSENIQIEIKDLKNHINYLDQELRKASHKLWDLEEKILDDNEQWKKIGMSSSYFTGYSLRS